MIKNKLLHVGKIVCVGRNYVAHIEELKNEIPKSMVVFMKPASAISDKLYSRHLKEEVHYEGELCFLVKGQKFIDVAFGLDLTKRNLQAELKTKGLPWERAKAFDGSALFSEFVSFEGDFEKLSVKLYIDGELIQNGNVSQMIYKPEVIFDEINSFSKLDDYDIVMSGTPKGVGVVKKGAKFEGQILYEEKVLISKEWVAL